VVPAVDGVDRGKCQGAAAELAAVQKKKVITKEGATEACMEQEIKLVKGTAGAAAGAGTEVCGVNGATAEATVVEGEKME
jgi:hypothetical protein